jgi:hypothetical protein
LSVTSVFLAPLQALVPSPVVQMYLNAVRDVENVILFVLVLPGLLPGFQ